MCFLACRQDVLPLKRKMRCEMRAPVDWLLELFGAIFVFS